jgi:hypothetical protein
VKPWQGRLVGCVLTMSVAAGLTSCTEPEPQPIPSPTPTVSAPTPSRITSPTPSAEELDLRGAEQAVSRFWRVIDRLSADPESDLTELTTVSRGPVAAQWARNINQYRYDQVTAKGRVAVRDVSASQTKDDNLFKVTACVDSSKVNLVDKKGKSVVPPNGPRRVAYDYTVQEDGQRWYVIKEKVTETC